MALISMWGSALRLRSGSLRLIGLRWLALLACFLPGRMMAGDAFTEVFGKDPHVASRAGAPPLTAVIQAFEDISGPMAVLGLGAVVFLIVDQMLSAACLTLCDPNRGDAKVSVWDATWEYGMKHILPMLRIVIVGAILFGIVGVIVGKIMSAWEISLQAAGASALYRARGLLIARIVLMAFGFASVGAVTYWARTLTIADERKRARRTMFDAMRVIWRAPVSAGLLFVALTAGFGLATGVVLTELLPVTGENTAGFFVWAAILLLQCFLWHWTWHVARLLYADPTFVGISGRGDENFGWWDSTMDFLRGLRR